MSHEVISSEPVSRGPIITGKTTLEELKKAGADLLADIPLTELLEFIRNQCLQVASDDAADEGIGWAGDFAEAATHVQSAIEAIDRGLKRNLQ